MTENYILITTNNPIELAEVVQARVEKGFSPQGGVAFCPRWERAGPDMFIQAMYRKPAAKKAKARNTCPDEFETLWLLYPKRNGSNPKNKAAAAYNARCKEGHTADEILDGLHRYSNWCFATHKTGTETVMQASRFFGPGLEFKNEWLPPEETAATLPKDDIDLEAYAKRLGMPTPGAYTNESWVEYRRRIERYKKHSEAAGT